MLCEENRGYWSTRYSQVHVPFIKVHAPWRLIARGCVSIIASVLIIFVELQILEHLLQRYLSRCVVPNQPNKAK
jgi:hypothetical protein